MRMKTEVKKLETVQLTRKGREITYTRIINAPRNIAWKVLTSPRFVPQHYGTNSITVVVDAWEFKEGGSGRLVRRDERGKEFVYEGKISQIIPNERVKYDLELDSKPRHRMIETETLEDYEGKTKYTVHVLVDSPEGLEDLMKSGWYEVLSESIDRFVRLVDSVKMESP